MSVCSLLSGAHGDPSHILSICASWKGSNRSSCSAVFVQTALLLALMFPPCAQGCYRKNEAKFFSPFPYQSERALVPASCFLSSRTVISPLPSEALLREN